ncbi:NAD(P)H-hydrate dehydratase [Kordiimonas aestuarii]|uniref:NAD(P)H-hydrate dehydratase n=1 Tax=Kordiimonas aestuarii TaxID=1005925 RepID=UPI0021D3166B|nr:NAD(P)H-hydrate dehydratase [Kordiimonas aestuarii]
MSDSKRSHLVLVPDEARQADAWAISHGVDGLALMEAAGRAVAEAAVSYAGTPLECDGDIVLLCGPGNNGGDGYVAARYLQEWGYAARIVSSIASSDLKGDAAVMASRWSGRVDPVQKAKLKNAAVIIDALFGTGLARPIEGELAALIDEANAREVFRLAVDVPSGLDAQVGTPLGACFHADATVTFFRKKPGQVIAPGRFLCGGRDHIHVADIGISDACLDDIKPKTFENIPTLWSGSFPYAGPITHKYKRGHLLVLGGKQPALGACRLACMAALRTGAGLVTLAAPSETYSIQATALTDVLVRQFDSTSEFLDMMADDRINVVLLGPGAGVSKKNGDLIHDVVARGRGLVLDADALTSLAGHLDILGLGKAGEIVLTPHDGEFVRLFPDIDHTDRIAAVRTAACITGAIVVLKGVSTLVAAPDGRLSIAANAPAWLSIGGTGDVLSGIVASLMGQGMPAFEAASAGVWLHGEAGMRAGRGLIASDLVDLLPSVLP